MAKKCQVDSCKQPASKNVKVGRKIYHVCFFHADLYSKTHTEIHDFVVSKKE